jgi:anti-sigma-K factor RskA
VEAADRSELEGHLRSCVLCRRSLRELEALIEKTQAINPESLPARDLWPGIAARIRRERSDGLEQEGRGHSDSFPWTWRLAAAAAMVLAVGLGAWLSRSELRAPADSAAGLAVDLAAEAELARVEDGVLQPRRDLAEFLAIQRDVLEPETLEAIEADARELDEAIGEIRQALAENVGDRRLKLLLAARYRQERDFLQRLSRV